MHWRRPVPAWRTSRPKAAVVALSWGWTSMHRRRRVSEATAGKHNRDENLGAVKLCFMHFGNCSLGVVDLLVHDIGCSAIDVNCAVS